MIMISIFVINMVFQALGLRKKGSLCQCQVEKLSLIYNIQVSSQQQNLVFFCRCCEWHCKPLLFFISEKEDATRGDRCTKHKRNEEESGSESIRRPV